VDDGSAPGAECDRVAAVRVPADTQAEAMSAVLRRAGGVCHRAELRAVATDHAIARAVRTGSVVRIAHGRYALPLAHEHAVAAHRLTGTLSHLSAAAHWHWAVKALPDQPWVTVPRHRNVPRRARDGIQLVWRDLGEADVVQRVTSPLRTVLDCAQRFPFADGLAVADSALRSGAVCEREITAAAARVRGPGRAKVLRVAAEADVRAANPFESVLRAIALDVGWLRVSPQVRITGRGLFATVDLADEEQKVVLEADSFAHHGTRGALVRDCERYDELVAFGWTVLRFTWEHVMLRPEYVRWCLEALGADRLGRPVPAPPVRHPEWIPA
jgi:very-short-patch-repair endonuclease